MHIAKLWPIITFCRWTIRQWTKPWTNWFKAKSWTMKWESLFAIILPGRDVPVPCWKYYPGEVQKLSHSFCCALLSLQRDDLVKVLTNPDTEDMEMCFPEQLVKMLTNPDTEDMEMYFPEQSSFHLGGNLYLIAEQDGILLTDKNTMSDIYFPLVRWVQLQTTWGYIDDAVHYLEHNRYTSLDVHLGANVFVTAESPALHLDIRHYYWMNGKRHPSSHGVSLDFEQYHKLKDVDRVLPDIFPDLKKTLWCKLTHQNVDSAMYCSECNPCCI